MENINKPSLSQEETIPLTNESPINGNPNSSEDLLEIVGVGEDDADVNESETTTQLIPELVETQTDRDPGNTSGSSTEPVNDNDIRSGGRGRKRKRQSKYLSLDVELLNSSKAVELLAAADDTHKSGSSATPDGEVFKKRKKRRTTETTEYGTSSSSSSSNEELGDNRNRGKKPIKKDLRDKLAIKRLNKLWPGYNNTNEDTESVRSGESSDQYFTGPNEESAGHTGEDEDGLTALDDNYNENPAGGIIRTVNNFRLPPGRGDRGLQPQGSSTPLAIRSKSRDRSSGRNSMDEDNMDEANARGGGDDILRKENERLRLDLEGARNEIEEIKRKAVADSAGKKTQHTSRSYLVPRRGVYGRLDDSIFKSFLHAKHEKDKVGDATVDPITGKIGGFGKGVEALFEDAAYRSRNVADVMSVQIVSEQDEKLKNSIDKAMEAMLKVVDADGRKREKEDKVSIAQMGEFVRRIFTDSFEADMHAITHNQIATVEAIATDLQETQKENVKMGAQIEANQKRIKKMEGETVSEEEMLRCISDEKQRDNIIVVKNYPRIIEIRKAGKDEKKKMICDDLREFNDTDFAINTDQIAAVFPSHIPENNKQMRQNGKGTLKIIFRHKMSGFYLRKFNGKYHNRQAPFGQIVEYRTRVEMREQKIYYNYVDEIAKETKPHILKEYGSIQNFETSLTSNARRTIDRLAQYEIKIANRRGRYGNSGGPNVQVIRKPDTSGAREIHASIQDAFYSQMETSLKRTINSLKRSESRRNQKETGSGGAMR